MDLIVVSLEEEKEKQQTEEDKKVQRIYEKGKETKRKILKGMLIMSDEIRILVHVLIILIVVFDFLTIDIFLTN